MFRFTQQLPGGARVAHGTEVGRPYLALRPARWQFPMLHELHLSPVFVGFSFEELALWTAEGSARKLKTVREWEG